MMHRISAIILVILILFAGCGKKNPSPSQTTPTDSGKTIPTPTAEQLQDPRWWTDWAVETTKDVQDPAEKQKALADLACAQAYVGRFSDAIATAKNIEDMDRRMGILRYILKLSGWYGNRDNMHQVITELLPVFEAAADNQTAMRGLVSIAYMQPSDEAVATAKKIRNAEIRDPIVGEIIRRQSDTGKFEDALATAEMIDNKVQRVHAIVGIGRRQMEAHEAEQARKTFSKAIEMTKTVDSVHECFQALRYIAEAQTECGLGEDTSATYTIALERLASAENGSDKDACLTTAAGTLAMMGRFSDAKGCAEKIQDTNRKIEAYGYIAQRLGEKGKFEEAAALVAGIQHNKVRLDAACCLAVQRFKAGQADEARRDFAEALSLARGMSQDYDKSYALDRVATSMASVGMFSEALGIASEIPFADVKVNALTDLAEKQIEKGNPADAATTFAQARDTAMSRMREDERDYSLGYVIRRQAEAGLLEDAIAIMETTASGKWNWQMDFVPEHLTEVKDVERLRNLFARLLVVANRLNDKPNKEGGSPKAYALLMIANAQARAGMLTEAIATAKTAASPQSPTVGLSQLVEYQAEAGMFDEALATAKEMPNPDSAVWRLIQEERIAGEYDKAFAAAEIIKDRQTRDFTVQQIFEAQVAKSNDGAPLLKMFEKMRDMSPSERTAYCRAVCIALVKKKYPIRELMSGVYDF